MSATTVPQPPPRVQHGEESENIAASPLIHVIVRFVQQTNKQKLTGKKTNKQREMARHRSVRGYNYDEDFEEDDLYGQSVEDDYGVSPATAAQFMYQRADFQLANFVDEPLKEEDEECEEQPPANSNTLSLSDIDKARLHSCLEEMRNIAGDAFPEPVMVQAVLNSNFEMEKALDSLFLQSDKTRPEVKEQRLPRSSREAISVPLPACTGIDSNDTPGSLGMHFEQPPQSSDLSCTCSGKVDKSHALSSVQYSHKPLVCSQSLDLRHLLSETYNPEITGTEKSEELKQISKESNQISGLSLSSLLNDEQLLQNAASFHNKKVDKCSEKNLNSSFKSLPSNTQNMSLAELAKGSLASATEVMSLEKDSWSPLSTSGGLLLSALANNVHSPSLTQPVAIGTISSSQKYHNARVLSQSLESNSSDVMSIGLEKLMQPADGMGSSESSFSSSPCLGGANLGSFLLDTPSLASLINKQEQASPPQIQSSTSSVSNASGTGNNSLSIGSLSLADLAKRHNENSTHTLLSSPRLRDLAPGFSNVMSKSALAVDLNKCEHPSQESISASALKPKAIKALHNSTYPLNVHLENVQPYSDVKQNMLCNAVSTKIILHETKNTKQQTVGSRSQKISRTNRTQLFKNPSGLAMALCFQSPNQLLRDKSKIHFRAFEYERQTTHVHVKKEDPLTEVKFFDFDVPSPDDVVKCLQKNAFTRGEVV
ncbi:HBS1-like protein isoform X3 [Petromyzon marinus]|uniref:HBS1-like protein isoform X3 n=1 Tax=Petromyzon marinus TaxID=7757 RepID=UPI003F722C39